MMKHVKRLLAYASAVFLLVAAVGGYLFWRDYTRFLQTSITVDHLPFELKVEKGASLRSITRELVDRGVIEHAWYMRWYAFRNAGAADIKAGDYSFDTAPTPVALIERLVSGKVTQYMLTIVEGWTFREMLAAVRVHPQITHTLPADAGQQVILDALGLQIAHPEGWFFPDTYLFPAETTDVAFLQRAHRAMQTVLDQEWQQRQQGLPLQTPYEALTLASIVEKETGAAPERSQIAGVFVRRLQKNMRLQTDPTVIYGLGDAFDGNLRRKDLRSDTPYNSYTRHGLPPTPIALPGREAIHAVLHPADGKALYFVSKGDGTHHFSATLKEHNRAVARYQLNKR